MIWLGDQVEQRLAKGRSAFQVLFYLICAELVAKLVFGYAGEGQSRRYVVRFFEEVCSDNQRDVLGTAFSHNLGDYLSWREAANFLYDVRCDVVHEGRYYEFHFKPSAGSIPFLTTGSHVAHIAVEEFRRVVIEGAVLGCRKLLNKNP